MRADEETRDDIDAATESQLLAQAETLMKDCDIVILSDYNKGVLTTSLIKAVMALATEAGIPMLVDPKKTDYALYRGASVITPNRKELSDVTGLPAKTDEEVTVAVQKLMDDHDFNQIIVTRSEDGMSVFDKGQDSVHLPADADSAVDVSGAGDTVIAALAGGLAAGATLLQAAQLASRAAALAVAKTATASIDMKELQGALKNIPAVADHSSGHEAYLCDWQDASDQIKRWQEQGQTVGFTNGCFDILHYGHVSYLNRARDKCDRFVIGLNHDQSIRILKGPDRPLHDEVSRATVIGALGAVDMVVLFGAEEEGDDNTPCALIEKIRPDIYFKGGDYTIDQLPEAKIMDSIGGRVEIMNLYEGHSTTATIAKMKKTEAA